MATPTNRRLELTTKTFPNNALCDSRENTIDRTYTVECAGLGNGNIC
jgi:hypothetical protein